MKAIYFILFPIVFISGCKLPGSKNSVQSNPSLPAVHFSSNAKWLREPVSFVYQNGFYNLYYLTSDTTYGSYELGQARSTDLFHWKEVKNTITAGDTLNIRYGLFVSDSRNTSGLKKQSKDLLVSLLLVNSRKKGKSDELFFLLSYSNDGGNNWIMSKENIHFPIKLEINRKPAIIWDDRFGKWIMTITNFNDINFFSSKDLINWKTEGTFSIPEELGAGTINKASLISLVGCDQYVLLVDQDQSGPNGGSWVQYFVGIFNGHTFLNQSKKIHLLDYGKDNYYNVFCNGLPKADKRTLFIGWMNNMDYSWKVAKQPWNGIMSLPKELGIELVYDEWLLTCKPVSAIKIISEQSIKLKKQIIAGAVDLTNQIPFEKTPVKISLTFLTNEMTRMTFPAQFGLRLETNTGESLQIGYDISKWCYFIDRSGLSFSKSNRQIGGIQRMPCYHTDSTLVLDMIIDNSSIELFTERGKLVMSENFLPETKFDKIILFTDNGKIQLTEGLITQLKSAITTNKLQ